MSNKNIKLNIRQPATGWVSVKGTAKKIKGIHVHSTDDSVYFDFDDGKSVLNNVFCMDKRNFEILVSRCFDVFCNGDKSDENQPIKIPHEMIMAGKIMIEAPAESDERANLKSALDGIGEGVI